jgi:ADP-ribosyl-[dinitrogen reductase] hydrolase
MTTHTTGQPVSTRHISYPQKFRATGAILGAAIGDALGAPFEFKPGGLYSSHFPGPVLSGTGEMIGGGGFGWAPGEFTDDTQMAMALAESLIAHGGLDLDDLWERFQAWKHSAVDVGIVTGVVLSQPVRHGAAEHGHHATGGRSASNGCVMRIAPVGVLGVRLGADATVALAAGQARLTHHDPAAAVGAALVAELIRHIIVTGEFRGVAEAILDDFAATGTFDAAVVGGYRGYVADGFDPLSPAIPGNGSVWTTVGQALWAVRSTDSFEAAMRAVIDLGGDTDTVAAVAGAVAGALYGAQRIPIRWTTYVHGYLRMPDGSQREYRMQDLIDVSRLLLGEGKSTMSYRDAPVGPRLVHKAGVHAANLDGAATAPRDHAVVSLCMTEERFLNHVNRRQIYIRDKENPQNDDLFFVVRDAVEAIEAFLAEGRDVVVHCHGGRSRTGLVLKAWYMAREGASHRQAHEWLRGTWEHYETWTQSFWDFLDTEWTAHVGRKGA